MRQFIVWNVFGETRGNVRLLAVYHYTKRADADAHAARVKGGHVIRSRQEREPHGTETHAEGEPIGTPADVRRFIVSEQPAYAPPAPARVKASGWTF